MKPHDIVTGQRFASLVVVGPGAARADGRRRWMCRCDCGGEVDAIAHPLVHGITKDCGCRKHGHATERTPTYRSWLSMRERCSPDPGGKFFKYYAGRDIGICARWDSFTNFPADMGERLPGTTLDRIDNDRGYEPGNCRWATPKQQNRNRRSTVLETHEPAQIRWLHNAGATVGEIARLLGVRYRPVYSVAHGGSWL